MILMIFLCMESLLFLTFTAVMFSTQLHSICSDETVSVGVLVRFWTGSGPVSRDNSSVCPSGNRASEEPEAHLGAGHSLGRAELGVRRSALSVLDQPLRWTQTTNRRPQTQLEGRSRVLRLRSSTSSPVGTKLRNIIQLRYRTRFWISDSGPEPGSDE